MTDPLDEAPPLAVLYDGACPPCRREQLLARFHVRGSDGQLLSGAQAFLALWAALAAGAAALGARLDRPHAPR